jgi:hypothetical protein
MVAPTVVKADASPNKVTYFLSINLGSANRTQKMLTGVFIPDNFRFGSTVDVILWLMGHHDNKTYPPNLGIDDYWKNYTSFKFREFVNTSNRNVILVAPTLGSGSEAGKLSDKNGLSWYLDQILAALQANVPLTNAPTLGNLVIACHSGGGWPMRAIATHPQTYLSNVKEFWGFDCLYNTGDEQSWLAWAAANGGKKLFIRYGAGGTDAKSENLKKLAAGVANIDVAGNISTHHNDVPSTYWQSFMRAASYFQDVTP